MRLLRLYLGDRAPEPGKDNGAALVGDYPDQESLKRAASEFPGARLWVEPIEVGTDDDGETRYSNAGAVEELLDPEAE